MTSSPCFVLQSPGRGLSCGFSQALLAWTGRFYWDPDLGILQPAWNSGHQNLNIGLSHRFQTQEKLERMCSHGKAHTHTHTHFQGRNQSCGRLAEGDDAPPEPSRPEAVKTVGSGFALLHRLWCCLNRGRAEAPAGGAGGTCGPRSSDRQDINRNNDHEEEDLRVL